MTTRVKAKGPDGIEKTYLYDPQSTPLGSGHTGVVYEGWEESRTDKKVAIKVSRSSSDADMQRELEILARLYAKNEPGGNAVLWAAGGQEIDVIPGAACMVMELIGGENQMSRRMANLGQTKAAPEANILEKEVVATEAGRQYAQLLARMADKGVISRGDRKATDFRLVPGGANAERLVVLDWNRAEIIDLQALEKEGRWSMDFINRRRADLELGQTGEIRIFARWWAEFVMGHSMPGALPAIDDVETDSAWAALTRGFRHILLRAEAAGTSRGFVSAVALKEALDRHAEYLKMDGPALLTKMRLLRDENSPARRDDMLALIDLAERRGLPRNNFSDYISWAELGGQDAAAIAQRALDSVKSMAGRWDEVRQLIATTLQTLGPATPDTAAAHLPLLRWDLAATAGSLVNVMQANKWTSDAIRLMDAFARLTTDSRAADEAKALIDDLGRGIAAGNEGLQPLKLELDLRVARDRATAIEVYQRLREMRPTYATALRMSMPNLDRYLADHDRASSKAASESDLAKTLQAAVKALFDQFAADVNAGRLPPADHKAARVLSEKTYRPKWNAYYDARTGLNAAGLPLPDDGGVWLDTLLSSMLRLRADDAAGQLADPPPAVTAALGDAAAIRRQCFGRWLELLEKSAIGGEPRWPDDIDRSLALVGRIRENGDPTTQARAAALTQQLEEAKTLQDSLQQRLGIDGSFGFKAGGSWEAFVERVTTAESTDISDALRQAVENRLEAWQPPAVAEDAFDADYPGRVAEGYRARTLLALRAARMLPANIGQYNEKLRALAADLEAGQANVAKVTAVMSAADGYASHMTTLNSMKAQLAELKSIKADFDRAGQRVSDSAGDIAENRRELQSWSNELDGLAGEIADKTDTANAVIGRVAPLAQMWLVSALDQAGRLDFSKALASVNAARPFLTNSSLVGEADNIQSAIQGLDDLSKKDNGGNDVWDRLLRVKDAMSAGNKKRTGEAWAEVKSYMQDWESNRVLQRLDQRIFAMPDMPSTPPPATAPEPGPIGTQPDSTAQKTMLGATTTLEQPPAISLDQRVKNIGSQWLRATNQDWSANSPKIRSAAIDTEVLIKENLTRNQLEDIQKDVRIAKNKPGQSDDFMSNENNYGHLFALDHKIKKLLNNNAR